MIDELFPAPEDLVEVTGDAIRHFYDYELLAHHPILGILSGLLGNDPLLAVQKLRALVVEAVEALRPPADSPVDSPAWRPYQVVYSRYILGKELAAVEADLGLGARQIQREQQKGFTEIAAWLWAQRMTAVESDTAPADVLSQEIARAATEPRTFDVTAQMDKAVHAVGALAKERRTQIALVPPQKPLMALGDPALFRQLLVSALSFLVRLPKVSDLRISVEPRGKRVVCTLGACGGASIDVWQAPEALQALAQANGAEVSHGSQHTNRSLCFSLPAVGGEWMVAIVEDNRDLVTLFSRYLGRHGYRVLELADPTTAFERIATALPDAVVLDVMMSGVDGWEILQKLRSDPRLLGVPVAVCSVLEEDELATSLGADAYLQKPVRPAQLLECLGSLLTSPHSGAVRL